MRQLYQAARQQRRRSLASMSSRSNALMRSASSITSGVYLPIKTNVQVKMIMATKMPLVGRSAVQRAATVTLRFDTADVCCAVASATTTRGSPAG
jgi:hypothetical protein